MRRSVLTGSAACALLIAACGGGGSTGASPDTPTAEGTVPQSCYELVQGGSRTVIKVEAAPSPADPDAGQVTVYSYIDGVEEFTPESTLGRLEPDAFVYADGTRLLMTDANLTWPQDSLLEGAVFSASPCP